MTAPWRLVLYVEPSSPRDARAETMLSAVHRTLDHALVAFSVVDAVREAARAEEDEVDCTPTPVLVLPAFAAPDSRGRGLAGGAQAYLRKPLPPTQLVDVLAAVSHFHAGPRADS